MSLALLSCFRLTRQSIVAELLLFVMPIVLMLFYPQLIMIYLLILAGSIYARKGVPQGSASRAGYAPATDFSRKPRKAFVTAFKAGALLLSLAAILAVDFPLFDRERLAKTEAYGKSLMDAGVGIVVAGMGIVSGMRLSNSSPWRALLRIVPLAVIGLSRAFAVKAVGYQVRHQQEG